MGKMERQKKMGVKDNKGGSDEAYEKGYEAGYAKGTEDGYEKGHEEGYEQGYDVGYERGYQKGLVADDSDDENLKDDYVQPEDEAEEVEEEEF